MGQAEGAWERHVKKKKGTNQVCDKDYCGNGGREKGGGLIGLKWQVVGCAGKALG